MFIRDQEQCELINMDNVYSISIEEEPFYPDYESIRRGHIWYVRLYYPDGETYIGQYKSEERAKAVMNEIAECCASGIDIYNMPKE